VSYGITPVNISLRGSLLEVVNEFTYLGAKIVNSGNGSSADIAARIGKATGAFARLRKCLWSQRAISVKTKMRVFNAIVVPTLLYASETWTVLAADIE